MKLSVNEAKLSGLWARNCATIQQVLILKYAFGPEKLPGARFSKVPVTFRARNQILKSKYKE